CAGPWSNELSGPGSLPCPPPLCSVTCSNAPPQRSDFCINTDLQVGVGPTDTKASRLNGLCRSCIALHRPKGRCYYKSSGGLIPNFSNIFLTRARFSGVSNRDSSGYSAQNSTSR